jgi:hypothetical protein
MSRTEAMAGRCWGPLALVLFSTPSHNQVWEMPMADERLHVATDSNHGVRVHVLDAHWLEAFQVDSIAGSSSADEVALSFGQLTRPLTSPGAFVGVRRDHRWGRWPSVWRADRRLGRMVHQRSSPIGKSRLEFSERAMS